MTTTDLLNDQISADHHASRVVEQPLPVDHRGNDTQMRRVDGHSLVASHRRADVDDVHCGCAGDQPLTTDQSTPVAQYQRAGGQPLASHTSLEAQIRAAGEPSDPTRNDTIPSGIPSGQPLSDDHTGTGLHRSPVVADTSAVDHVRSETHTMLVDGNSSSQPPTIGEAPPTARSSDGWLELRVWAEMFNDAQEARIEGMNKIGFSVGTKKSHDITDSGKYYKLQNKSAGVDPVTYLPYIHALELAEEASERALHATYKRVVPKPIRAWQVDAKGIGVHLVSRLLGHLGDPRIATPHFWQGTGTKRTLMVADSYERTLAQLWQYCGHGDPTRRIRKGMTADELAQLGKPDLKMIVHLIADRAILEPGRSVDLLLTGDQHADTAQRHYRRVYEERRLVTAERLHATECVRCGPSGKPAAVLSPWSKAHQQADALRIVGKEILRDLWTIS